MAIEFVELIGRKKPLMELDIDNYLDGRDIDNKVSKQKDFRALNSESYSGIRCLK